MNRTPHTFQANDSTELRFCGLRYEPDMMRATCSWSSPYCNSYRISGWHLDAEIDVPQIVQEDLWLDLEQRGLKRDRVAIPVVVHQKNGQPKIHCFSRNVSTSGICLIGNEEPQTSDFSLLELARSNGGRSHVVAECRWTNRIGQSHWISGWQFPRLARVQNFQMRYFRDVLHGDDI